jgi:hypothetical protein
MARVQILQKNQKGLFPSNFSLINFKDIEILNNPDSYWWPRDHFKYYREMEENQLLFKKTAKMSEYLSNRVKKILKAEFQRHGGRN